MYDRKLSEIVVSEIFENLKIVNSRIFDRLNFRKYCKDLVKKKFFIL